MAKRVRVLTTNGLEFISLSRHDASTVGQHWNSVRIYLERGDEAALHAFRGQRVAMTEFPHMPGMPVGGYELETDLDAIEWHAVRGEVTFESIYDEVV